jgi:hypothetical protein
VLDGIAAGRITLAPALTDNLPAGDRLSPRGNALPGWMPAPPIESGRVPG